MTLASKAVGSTAWSTIGLVISQLINLGRLAILARILSPDEFGVYAMVMVFYMFLMNVGDLGSSAAIIQRQRPTQSLLSTVFFLNLMFGAALSVIVWLVAPLVGAAYGGQAEVTELVRWMAVLFLITGSGFVHSALLRKDLQFKQLTIADLSSNLMSTVVAIYLAMQGYGYFAFGAQMVTHSTMLTLMVWSMRRWVPSPVFSIADLRSVLAYTVNLTFFNFIDYAANNADKFLVGKFLGSSAVGAYYLGFRLLLQPMKQVLSSVTKVVFSTLATVQDDLPRFREIFLKVVYLICVITAPVCMFIMATSDLLIEVLFGQKWAVAAPVLAMVAPAGLIQSIMSPAGIICLVKERTDLLLKLSIMTLFIIPVCVAIGLQFGIEGAAMGYSVAIAIILVPSLTFTLRLVDIRVATFLHALRVPVATSVAMGLAVWAIRAAGLADYVPSLWLQVLVLAVFAGLFFLAILGRPLLHEVQAYRARAA